MKPKANLDMPNAPKLKPRAPKVSTAEFAENFVELQRSGKADKDAYRQMRYAEVGLGDARYTPSTGMDVMYEIYLNNLLSGPPTHVTNFISNTVETMMAPVETAAKALVTTFNKPQDRVYYSEIIGDIYGTALGIMKAVQFAGKRAASKLPGGRASQGDTAAQLRVSPGVFNSSRLEYVNRRISSANFNLDENSVFGKITDVLGTLLNVPGSALNASDISYKIIHDTRAKTRWATHQWADGAYKSLKEAMDAADSNVDLGRRAVREAEDYTYTGRPNMPIFSWITDTAIDKLPGARWIIPFKRTIANIAERSLERSPLALAVPTLAKRLAHNDPAERATAQARLLAGTGVLVAASMMFGDNLIGAAPRDKINRELWDKVYGGEFLLKFGDGVVKLDQLGIIGQQLKTIAMYRQAIESAPDNLFEPENSDQLVEFITPFLAPVTEVLYNSTYAASMAQAFEAIGRAQDTDSAAPILQYAERIAAKTVPVFGSTAWELAQRSDDPVQRDTAQLGAVFQSTIPKQRELLRTVYDDFGQPMIVNNYRGPNSDHPQNPYDPENPIANEYIRLKMRIKAREDELRADSPGKVAGDAIDAPKVKLSNPEWDRMHQYIREGITPDPTNPEHRFMQQLGPLPPFKDFMTSIVTSPAYKILPDEVQQGVLRGKRRQYQEQLNKYMRADPELRPRVIDETVKKRQQLQEDQAAKQYLNQGVTQ